MQGLLMKITPKHRIVIAEVGNVSLVETVFTIGPAAPKNANLTRITHQRLLPSRLTSKYLTIKEASEETGLKTRKLARLVRDEKVEAIKIKGKWLILKESLLQYIATNEA